MAEDAASGEARAPFGVPLGNDDPNNQCFGCSPHNDRGLRLTFMRTESRTVESRYTVPEHFCGAPQVVHGGIQAAMLDEVLGYACQTAFEDPSTDADLSKQDLQIVTASFALKYRIPVPTGAPLVLRGVVDRVEGRNVFVNGVILDADARELTRAEARWVRLA